MSRHLVGCLSAVACLLACNNPPPTPTTCTIQGGSYTENQPNPANPCQVCVPSKGSTSWTDQPAGTACGTGGTQFCSGGACLTGCLISGTFTSAGSPNPANGCQSCEPTKSATDWTPLGGVVPNACAAGEVCQAGACTAGCALGSTFVASGAPNPANPCQSCQPAQSVIAWTDLAPGSSCAHGGAICNAGSCQSGCQVGGVFFANGTPSPTDRCQSCQPAISTTSFSPFTGVAPGACDGGAYCDQGSCSGGCAINGVTEVPGTLNPANECQSCQPSVNLTGWSDVTAGTSCGSGGAVCAGGVCVFGCQVGGILYAPGSSSPLDPCQTCQPAVSATTFSPFNGLPAGGCNGGQTCNQGTCEVACFIRGSVVASRSYKPNDTSLCCSPTVDPTTWTQSFTQGATYTAGIGNSFTFGSSTQLITAGDFNGDGFQDVAVVNSSSSTVSIFLNKGDGTFLAQAVYPTGSNPQAVAAGDVNNDSLDDLVVAVGNGSRLGVLLSQGFDAGFDAGLAAESDLAISGAGFAEQTLAIKDLNGDLAPDLVAGSGSHDNSVSVFLNLNNGTGGFGLETRYNPGINNANQVALGDFDGNSFPDIAILQRGFGGPSSVAVLLNDGTGVFSAGVSYAVDMWPQAVAAGDFNADHVSDLVVATYYQTDTRTGIGDGGLSPSVAHALTAQDSVGAADLNGDGLADVVVLSTNGNPGAINFLISQGNGTFDALSSLPANVGSSFVIRDFNGDGAPDLAIMNNTGGGSTQTWTLWLNSCP